MKNGERNLNAGMVEKEENPESPENPENPESPENARNPERHEEEEDKYRMIICIILYNHLFLTTATSASILTRSFFRRFAR